MGLHGTFLSYHMAGGEQGMTHFMRQFGPTLKLPWTRLEAPQPTEDLVRKLTIGTHEQAAGRTVQELERLRDNCLIAIMRALEQFDVGAGRVLAQRGSQLAVAEARAQDQVNRA